MRNTITVTVNNHYRQQEVNNVLAMGIGASNTASYGLSAGVFTGRPGATNSMIPLTQFHNAPDLPPWKDPYNTNPRNVTATPNPYTLNRTQSDTYTVMNPAGSAFVPGPGVPPPQYEACSTFKKDLDKELYSEIPGEYLTVQSGEVERDAVDQPQPQYGNDPSAEIKLQLHGDTEREDLSTLSENSVQEVYGN
jgi:hypothetical protein